MDRLFCLLGLLALLAHASHCAGNQAEPAFFSMLFPQLMFPQAQQLQFETTPGEAVEL